MGEIDDGGPAFPQHKFTPSHGGGGYWTVQGGMTLRDWLAGQALAGYCASGDLNPYGIKSNESWKQLAVCMFDIADAMIAARNGGSK